MIPPPTAEDVQRDAERDYRRLGSEIDRSILGGEEAVGRYWIRRAVAAEKRVGELHKALAEARDHLTDDVTVCSFLGHCEKCGSEFEGTHRFCSRCVGDYLYAVLKAENPPTVTTSCSAESSE